MDAKDKTTITIPADSPFWRHARVPRNMGFCDHASASATGVGSCGDKIQVDLSIRHHTIEQIRCRPEGCVYTLACSSAMSVLAQGRTIDDALQLQPEDVVNELGGLPDDHLHCARLAVNTLGDAIADYYGRKVAGAADITHAKAETEGG